MKENRIMLTIMKNNQWECSQDTAEVYFPDLSTARSKGVELLNKFNSEAFKIIKLTTGNGHYRTLGFFNKNNEYLR